MNFKKKFFVLCFIILIGYILIPIPLGSDYYKFTFFTFFISKDVSFKKGTDGYDIESSQIRKRIPEITLFPIQTISGWYAKTNKTVYYRGEPLPDVKLDTFKVIQIGAKWVDEYDASGISYESWSKDNRHVYYGVKMVENADPYTFKLVLPTSGIGKDNNHVFSRTEILPDIDAATFEVTSFERNYKIKDKYSTYQLIGDKLIKATN